MIASKPILGDEFMCPICNHLLFRHSEPTVSPCPHLVFAFFWSAADPNSFVFARADFAQRLVGALHNDPAFRKAMETDEITVSQEDCDAFVAGSFQPGDGLAELFGSLPVDFESLLEPNTALHCDDGYYGGLHLAVEGP